VSILQINFSNQTTWMNRDCWICVFNLWQSS